MYSVEIYISPCTISFCLGMNLENIGMSSFILCIREVSIVKESMVITIDN